ncbi:MAG: F0F1 ATP synthase subunit beta, partial [Patescibacteria group bacterium]
MNKGTIIQITGPVVDVEFEEHLPQLRYALEVQRKDGGKLVLEVSQHLGGNRVRCIALDSTDGLQRKMEAVDTGSPITVPVGEAVLGRMFNVLGEPVDGLAPLKEGTPRASIYEKAPAFQDQEVEP